MIYELEEDYLNEYANKHNIYDLDSEDILKLMYHPHCISSIAHAFKITEKEFNNIRKNKGIRNSILENSIRNIETILYYFDNKNFVFICDVREKLVDYLARILVIKVSREAYYIKSINSYDFSINNIKKDIIKKNIDIKYRMEKYYEVIDKIEDFVIYLNEKARINKIEDADENYINFTMNNGEKKFYKFEFSDEAYNVSVNKKIKRKSKGVNRNQQKDSKTKYEHGKLGEIIALESEKKRMKKMGLDDLIDQVKLVSQVSEDITYDGVGYDLLSFNEQREKICVEIKTHFGNTDRPFFVSKKEVELLKGIIKEHECVDCLIYYVLVNDSSVVIKHITSCDFRKMKLEPVLYKVVHS